jgi:non-specific serine/threonine protein kinase/serine/threonine-protein kinase
MALRKEPERRYASVGLLAEDVRRYLDGLPVLAHPATFRYRARKFVCRNAIAVAAASLLFLTLAAGVVATAKQTRIARTERARAERRFQDVRKLANSLLFELHDSIEAVPGTLATRQLIVQRGLEYLDGLAPESGDDRVLKSELAVAYDRVGALTFDVNMALGSHRKALALNQALVQAEPANSKYESQLASSYDLLASVLRDYGDSPGALRYSRDAAAVMERLVSLHPENREWRASQANMYQTLGTNLSRVGRYAEALDIQRKALAINQAMLAADRSAVHARLAVVESYIYLSRSLLDLTDSAAALDAGRQALSLAEPVVAAHPGVPAYRRELWLAHARIAQALENLGRLPESLAAYRSGLDIIQSIAAADPGDRGNRRGVAWTLLALAHLLGRMNRVPEAIRTDQQAIAISRHLLQEDPNKLETTIDLGNMYTQLAAVGKQVDAFRQAREFFEAAARRDPANAVVERGRAELDRLSR